MQIQSEYTKQQHQPQNKNNNKNVDDDDANNAQREWIFAGR